MKKQEKVMRLPEFLREKRDQIIWSLADQQEWPPVYIQMIFNFKHLSTVMRIIERKPKGWKSPWEKHQ